MSDFIFIAATIVFFAICVLYIKWCDSIIGSDDLRVDATQPAEPAEPTHEVIG